MDTQIKSDGTGAMAAPREYFRWKGMIQRCTKRKHKGFKYYGGRGIRVCERWLESFQAFRADMGDPPSPQHSLDRIDNDGHYEPGNVRWATIYEQSRNKRWSRRRPPHYTRRCIALTCYPDGPGRRCLQARAKSGGALCHKHKTQLARIAARMEAM